VKHQALTCGIAVVLGMVDPSPAVAGATAGGIVLEPVPGQMDSTNQAGWWSPVAAYGGDTYFAFDAPAPAANQHEIQLARRDRDGTWSVGCLHAPDGGCVRYGDDIGHNQPSIAIDGTGRIHAFVSMHANQWRYYRSDQPGSVTTLTDHSAEMADQGAGVTYPTAASAPNGDVYAIGRITSPETGAYGSGRLYRFDVRAGTWQRVAVFAVENGFSVYPDQVQVDRLGQVHLLWEWADGGASGVRHLGSYLAYQPWSGRFVSAAGRQVTLPVTTGTGGDVVYQPLEGTEDKNSGTSSVDPGVQSAKLALPDIPVLPGLVAYRYRPEPGALFQIRTARWDGRQWVRETVYDGDQETEAAIAVTYARGLARIYYTVKPPVCDPGSTDTGGLFVTERRLVGGVRPSPGQWQVRVLDTAAQILRLATLTRADGTDVLYLAAPNIDDPSASRLYYATLPRQPGSDGQASQPAAGAPAYASLAAETNLAYDAEVTVSSMLTPQNNGKCVVDGNRVERNSRWISARGDLTPTVTVTLAQPIGLDRVDVYSGFFGDSQAIVRSFTVEALVDGGWQPVAAVAANTRNPAVAQIVAPVLTDQVRLVLTDPSGYSGGSDLARIFEVEIFGTPGGPQ
jgi:BNR repeat-containing family member/F5/8 type C domain